jgi:hypothetical protein
MIDGRTLGDDQPHLVTRRDRLSRNPHRLFGAVLEMPKARPNAYDAANAAGCQCGLLPMLADVLSQGMNRS